jgi:hypothetical protein
VASPLLFPAGTAQAAAGTITPVIRGTVGNNGWYTSNVTLNWVISPMPDSSSGCDAVTFSADTAHVQRTCSATWGSSSDSRTEGFKIDKTPPAVSGGLSRNPDANGWYNHAVSIGFSGSDATSGVAGCTSARYAGPDNGRASVSGSCTDNAGNAGSAAVSFPYDSTPPQLKKLGIRHGNRALTFRWQVSPDTQRLQIVRAPGKHKLAKSVLYSGKGHAYRDKQLRPGARYRYTLSAFDQANNEARKTITLIATGALLSPLPGARVTNAPRLSWARVKGASYYNVQLVRGGRIFSAWPSGTSFKLPKSWVYHGHHYRLHAGVYKWFVWPGYGLLAANKYGHVLGRSSFLYAR